MPSLTLRAKSRNWDFLKRVEDDNPGAKVEPSSDNDALTISCPGRLVIHRKRADDILWGKEGRCPQSTWDGLLLTKNKADRLVQFTPDIIILEDEEATSRSRAKPGDKMFQARLSIDLYKRLEVTAALMDLSMAEVARRAIASYLDEVEEFVTPL